MKQNLFASAVAMALLSGAATASTFGVSPIRVELAGAARTAALTVANNAKSELVLKVDAVTWALSAEGQEQYSPTDKLVFFPKELVLAPGASRTIRVGLTQATLPAQEETFRLFIRQQAPTAPEEGQKPTQISMVVNFGVPVFVRRADAKPALEYTAQAVEGALAISATNTGQAHARMESIGFKNGAGPKDMGSPYVLQGMTRTFRIKVSPEDCGRGPKQTLVLEQDAGAHELAVDISDACK